MGGPRGIFYSLGEIFLLGPSLYLGLGGCHAGRVSFPMPIRQPRGELWLGSNFPLVNSVSHENRPCYAAERMF